ncbi:UNVERIFIED_CONTAM: hypothetical protein PYX00_010334 [Menopon gallinae]|uniref:ZP domain-containing protein n=1 Tax=Menopon gallinae TaxID=328185 RepID=A0AAW2HF77_9NEOP
MLILRLCPVDDKLISRFRGSWSDSGVFETQVFAYMKTFRFTGSPALYIECDVRMCHGRCPNQPCHWRNSKNVKKRSTETLPVNDTHSVGLSENINLFQSLRVLQEGETALDPSVQNSTLINSVCLKYSAFTTILGFVITILCLLISSLTLVCIRLRKYQKCKTESEARLSPKFDHKSYMIHKGRIN